jgi:hypothetical protein
MEALFTSKTATYSLCHISGLLSMVATGMRVAPHRPHSCQHSLHVEQVRNVAFFSSFSVRTRAAASFCPAISLSLLLFLTANDSPQIPVKKWGRRSFGPDDAATIPQPCGRVHPFFKNNTLFFKLKYMI